VRDVQKAFAGSVARGAKPVLEPTFVSYCAAQQKRLGAASAEGGCHVAEVELYGDVVLRYLCFADKRSETVPFLPHLAPMEGKIATRPTFGLRRIDHAVGNVPDLLSALNRIQTFTGFHEFAEFTTDDVGTVDSGLNSVVLASDTEDVLLPLNEPTVGKRKSQIQTFLEQNEGAGLQHLALKTDDIVKTIEMMRKAEEMFGGFDLMKRPSDEYYRELPARLGDQLTPELYKRLEELGILADADDEGLLLQIFTKPVGDRPTFFFEIIQRIGCLYKPDEDAALEVERPGCGGFGQGNFRELFRAIEEHEKTLKV
jgi:4-hydroxyphenylpyruvate dioxygenase